ncbi:MAG: hypothetical protein E3J72_00535 [Planctomycetota bacterium]|nr:MAG: hypothetical protein E3J72_00535 [Planctomycetota bacterium]
MDQNNANEAGDRPMTRSERIAARKEAREELVAQMAAKKKKALLVAAIVGIPLAVIATVVVCISFAAGTKVGKKTDWKAGDSFTFTEKWAKVIPPAKASEMAFVNLDSSIYIEGTCTVKDVSAGVPTKLEIDLAKFTVRGIKTGEKPVLPMKIVATRSGPGGDWSYEKPGLPEYCPVRADFLLTCGLDLSFRKWRKMDETYAALPRWATPGFPVKDMPEEINYTCDGGADPIKFKIYTTSHEIAHTGDVTIDGKKYRWQFETKGSMRIDSIHNMITNFNYRVTGYVNNYVSSDDRSRQNEDAPGFGITVVQATREWK